MVHSIDPKQSPPLRLHNTANVQEDEALNTGAKDDLYKFKRYISPKKSYEVYLQIEKAQQQYKLEMAKKMDSMEQLADKIRKGKELSFSDYKSWVNYNFLVFSEEE